MKFFIITDRLVYLLQLECQRIVESRQCYIFQTSLLLGRPNFEKNDSISRTTQVWHVSNGHSCPELRWKELSYFLFNLFESPPKFYLLHPFCKWKPDNMRMGALSSLSFHKMPMPSNVSWIQNSPSLYWTKQVMRMINIARTTDLADFVRVESVEVLDLGKSVDALLRGWHERLVLAPSV